MTGLRMGPTLTVAGCVAALVALEVSMAVRSFEELSAQLWAALSGEHVVTNEPARSVHAAHTELVSAPLRSEPTRVAVTVPALDAGAGELLAASVAGATEPPGPAAARSLARCPGELRLLASIVNAAHPHRSIAAVKVHGGTRLLNVGEQVQGLTLVALRPARAILRREPGSLCMMPVFLPASERPRLAVQPPRKDKRAAVRPAAAGLTPAELSAGIRRISPTSFAVSRALLIKALASPASLRRGARFRMVPGQDQTPGWELMALPPESALSHLGLQKGDVVSKLNGHDLSEPRAALQAFAQLKTAGRFSLSVLRNGAPQDLTYLVE